MASSYIVKPFRTPSLGPSQSSPSGSQETAIKEIALKATAFITNAKTGETRAYATEWFPAADFQWRENNYSCNCNRSLFFQEAGGVALEDREEDECGDGGYPTKIVAEDGTILFED